MKKATDQKGKYNPSASPVDTSVLQHELFKSHPSAHGSCSALLVFVPNSSHQRRTLKALPTNTFSSRQTDLVDLSITKALPETSAHRAGFLYIRERVSISPVGTQNSMTFAFARHLCFFSIDVIVFEGRRNQRIWLRWFAFGKWLYLSLDIGTQRRAIRKPRDRGSQASLVRLLPRSPSSHVDLNLYESYALTFLLPTIKLLVVEAEAFTVFISPNLTRFPNFRETVEFRFCDYVDPAGRLVTLLPQYEDR